MWQDTGSTNKSSVSLNPTVSGSFCWFRWVQLEERESSSNDNCCVACWFRYFYLVSLFVSVFSLPDGLMPVPSPYSSFRFIYAEVICSSSARMLFYLSFWSSWHILENRCRLFLFFLLLLFCSLFWSGLFCCVILPDMLAFHLLYLDNCECFVFLCLTVCDDNFFL